MTPYLILHGKSARVAFLSLLVVCVCSAATSGGRAVLPKQPASIAVAADGGLYIADLARNQILERSRSGSYSVIAGKLDRPYSLLRMRGGALYFVQAGTERNSVIREITPAGVLRTVAGLHPACPANRAATSIPAQAALMSWGELSLGPGGVLEVSTDVCPNVTDLGPFLELTASGELRKNSPDTIGAASIDCGDITEGRGFAAFLCESGGGATALGHPKELLVVRSNGSTAAYPSFGAQSIATGDGEVVAGHDDAVVRVTSHGISTLVSERAIDGLFSDSPRVGAINGLAVDQHGDVFVVADLYVHKVGCLAAILERAATGALRTLWSATSRVCY